MIAAKPMDKICLALDIHDEEEIRRIVRELKDVVGYFKFNSAYALFGPSLVHAVKDVGGKVFLDLKLHDIPNTLAGYGEAVTRIGVDIVTVHVAGGSAMLREFVNSADRTAAKYGVRRPKLIGISVLTSINQQVLNQEVGVSGSIEDVVSRRAELAVQAGLDGLVCSAHEVAHVRALVPADFFLVTPGVRPAGASGDDHLRVATYGDALRGGSDLLVVGRTLLSSPNPRAAALELQREIESERHR